MQRSIAILALAVVGCAAGGRAREPAPDADRADAGASSDAGAPDAPAVFPMLDAGPIGEADAGAAPPRLACDPADPHRVDAPADAWGWLAIPESLCGRGTSTGIAIRRSTRSRNVVVFLMGGGGCYDRTSCDGGRAANLDGYDQTTFAREFSFFEAGSIFDATSPENPFRDWSIVFVPYCTGDFHSGSRVADYGVHHVGHDNVRNALAYVAPTFCDAERVVLTGSSAGGFGSVFNYEQVAAAFTGVRVDLIDDSGPLHRPPSMPRAMQDVLRASWGQIPNLPADCPRCAEEWHEMYPYLAGRHPTATISILTSMSDHSIGTYFGMTPWSEAAGLDDLADHVIAPLPRARVFYLAGNDHVWLSRALGSVSSRGVTLSTFLRRQIEDDPSWSSVRP